MVEDHGKTRIGAQALAAGAGGQVHAGEVHRHGADGAHAVEAELDLKFRAEGFEAVHVVENTGGGFAMGTPNPGQGGVSLEAAADFGEVERIAPGNVEQLEVEPETPGMVGQALAKFTVAQNQAASLLEQELAGNDVVGQSARA